MQKLSFILAICFLMSVSAVACTHNTFSGGYAVTPEYLESLSAEIFTTAEPAETYPDGTVHWTAGGSVYHLDADCRHLRRSKEILHGTMDEATDAGKEKVCSACGKSEE